MARSPVIHLLFAFAICFGAYAVSFLLILTKGLHTDLALPMITVMGSQSVGKTSVLESLVGLLAVRQGN